MKELSNQLRKFLTSPAEKRFVKAANIPHLLEDQAHWSYRSSNIDLMSLRTASIVAASVGIEMKVFDLTLFIK